LEVAIMVNMTLAIPEDLHKLMEKHKDIKWSEVARKAMWEKARKMELLDKLLEKSEITEKNIEELSRKIKKDIAKKHSQKK
jgi:hypothetical protein